MEDMENERKKNKIERMREKEKNFFLTQDTSYIGDGKPL